MYTDMLTLKEIGSRTNLEARACLDNCELLHAYKNC